MSSNKLSDDTIPTSEWSRRNQETRDWPRTFSFLLSNSVMDSPGAEFAFTEKGSRLLYLPRHKAKAFICNYLGVNSYFLIAKRLQLATGQLYRCWLLAPIIFQRTGNPQCLMALYATELVRLQFYSLCGQ